MRKAHSHRAKKFNVAPQTKRKNRKGDQVRLAAFETLEGRTLLSNSVSLSSGTLYIDGNSTGNNSLVASLINSGKSINASAGNGHAITVPLSSVKQIQITGGSGNDSIFVDSNIKLPVTINGGQGNDNVRGGGGSNSITEGDGADWINGRGSSNHIQVGNGGSTILGGGNVDTIIAGNGNDLIDGSAGNDSITAGNGNDTITGDAGNDTIVAGNGKDNINGGLGNDRLTVGTGADTVIPGSGSNYITLGSKSSTVVSSAGSNTIVYASSGESPSKAGSSTGSTGSSGPSTSGGSTGTASTGTGSTTNTGSASTGSINWTSYSAVRGSGTAPTAVMQILAPVATVGIPIDTRALASSIGYGSPIDANFQWNFGDPNGEYNTLPGFNASHIYDSAGTFTITLTVTNALHQSSTVATSIRISPDTRRGIYVNAYSGNDNNNGLSPQSPVQSAARADALVGNNTEVFFARGQIFNLGQAFKLDYQNVLVGAYGSGNEPIINYTAPSLGSVIFTTNSKAARGVTVQDVTVTTLMGSQPNNSDMPMGVMAGGYAVAVLRCGFDYVEYDVNASAGPVGLTVEDNSSPINGGLQGYFLWDEGTDTTVIGNYVNGSVHEHVMRTSSATEILAYQNNFSNYDGKGGIEIHVGSYAWIDSNTVNDSDIRVGPLGLWGEPVSDTTTQCVIQNNRVNNSDIAVFPGAQDISIRNNIVTRPDKELIDLRGQDGYGRQSADIRILNNTGILTGSTGNFLKIESHTDDVLLENNLLVQPNLAVGGYSAAPVFVDDSSLSDFYYINGNVWQQPKVFYATANGGVNWVGTSSSTANYETAAKWNAQPEVGTDYFSSTPITSSDAPTSGSLASYAASPVQGVFSDIYGNIRPANAQWTAGAV